MVGITASGGLGIDKCKNRRQNLLGLMVIGQYDIDPKLPRKGALVDGRNAAVNRDQSRAPLSATWRTPDAETPYPSVKRCGMK